MATGDPRWLERQRRDPYVARAQAEGWRSRAAFKLQEMDRRFGLLRPGMRVVDLGAAPGGWSQYAARRLGDAGEVLALDRLAMEPLPGVVFLQTDFATQEGLAALLEVLGGRPVDLVLSDMAPNITGVRSVDQPRAMGLAELALELVARVAAPGAAFVVKVFEGEGIGPFVADCRARFARVRRFKPGASRARSREWYLVAEGFRR